MHLDLFIAKATKEIENQLDRLVPSSKDLLYSPLFQAARYSLLSPGKRFRPLLVLAVAESYGVPLEHTLLPACAIELVHTYSLIHDDLPCMDNDDLRRGQPTLHKIYPEWHALLTGDYLLTYAFEILAQAPFLNAEQKIALIHSLSFYSGAHGMIGGQMIDLLFEGKVIDWKMLQEMHRGKTAGLIMSALEFGGIIANLKAQDITCLKEAGSSLGIAFQLVDDILDHTGTQKEKRQLTDSDKENKKATAISILGIDETYAKAHHLLERAKQNMAALARPVPLLHALFERMIPHHDQN